MANKMGVEAIAFMVGILGSLLVGLLVGLKVFASNEWITVILVLAGIVIGLMSIKKTETVPMMLSALVIGGGAGVLANLPWVGALVASMLGSLALVVVPTGIVLALITVVNSSKK